MDSVKTHSQQRVGSWQAANKAADSEHSGCYLWWFGRLLVTTLQVKDGDG